VSGQDLQAQRSAGRPEPPVEAREAWAPWNCGA
jgi:hypothetical protein